MFEIGMFDFGITVCADGTEIIDKKIKTAYNELTAIQMVAYTELDNRLFMMDRLERKARQKQSGDGKSQGTRFKESLVYLEKFYRKVGD